MAQGENLIVRYGPASRPWAWKLAGNLWPPLLFAGVRVEHIAPDFRNVRVRLAKSPLTANMFGTQFGGSMFAMTDPFWAIMLSRNLGPRYAVWDRRAEIEFLAPGRTALTTEFTLSGDDVGKARADAEDGDKVLRWFDNEIRDRDGVLVARVRKQVYIRRKR